MERDVAFSELDRIPAKAACQAAGGRTTSWAPVTGATAQVVHDAAAHEHVLPRHDGAERAVAEPVQETAARKVAASARPKAAAHIRDTLWSYAQKSPDAALDVDLSEFTRPQ